MAASAATKIFLSHKGLDKPRVREFKQTLQQLGYQPWLDEDALKAGDHLERGLLQGMEESCAAVFFITPAFKDEGYLATEVDYAVQQLRAKGKRFAIIALSFCDEAGNEGQVPKLLQSYVWKHPKHDLEAIREIVRAVPLALGEVRWAAGIEGVADLPVAVSTVGELTPEAKAILLAAAEANGRVYHPKLLNADILQAGDKEMLPDQSPRTVAAWRAGLEELRRRGYVKDVGHKGEMFEVVDLGYKAADVLAQSQSE